MQDTPETPGGAPDPATGPAPGAGTPPPGAAVAPPPPALAFAQTGARKSLVERAKDIVTSPKTEWPIIDAEPGTVSGLFTGYAMILAAIGPIASVIGLTMIGFPIGYALTMALISYAVALGGVFLNAIIIDAFAPSFGGTKNLVQATKVAVYSATPVWLAGILNLIPQLAPLTGLVALAALGYGVYLLYLGLPRLMRVAPDKTAAYLLVVIGAWVVIYLLLAFVIAGMLLSMFYGSALGGGGGRIGY